MIKKTLLFIFFCCAALGVWSQTIDSLAVAKNNDSTLQAQFLPFDSTSLDSFVQLSKSSSFLLAETKSVMNNVQQYNSRKRNVYVFLLLLVMLGIITYVKVAFGKELEELLQSIVNQNYAQQIFRTQSAEISFSSFLLHLNFIVTSSLYLRFILVKYFHASVLEKFSSILFLIFLFTFFYVLKMATMQLIGVVFELKDECKEYVYHFTTVCKTVGLTLIPALFIFYTAQEIFFNFIFFISIFICAILFLLFVWRGLSTAYKLLYRSVYHFFIYVCVVEISMMFLFFKLLTKTII